MNLVVTLPVKIESSLNLRDRLIADIEYLPDTGRFVRIRKSGPNVVVGAEAGHVDRQGYRRIWIDGKLRAAHQLAWLWVHGVLPDSSVDHINGQRDDNRIANLRVVDHATNLQNQRRARVDNRLGVLGVRHSGKRFDARIWVDGRGKTIGTFDTVEEASAAYIAAKRELHPGCTL